MLQHVEKQQLHVPGDDEVPAGHPGGGPADAHQGPAGPGTDAFASFYSDVRTLPNGSAIPLYPLLADPTGAITQPGSQTIALQPGDYLVSYKVSATLNQPGYMQVTPSYGGAPHLEYGVYFATTATGSSAVGSAHFILPAPSATTFSLTYSGSVPAQNGEINLTFLRLRRPV